MKSLRLRDPGFYSSYFETFFLRTDKQKITWCQHPPKKWDKMGAENDLYRAAWGDIKVTIAQSDARAFLMTMTQLSEPTVG